MEGFHCIHVAYSAPGHPDMTIAVDCVLKTNYLSIYVEIYDYYLMLRLPTAAYGCLKRRYEAHFFMAVGGVGC